jgi:hypothetical protein
VVVGDLGVFRSRGAPTEADAPLLVHPDAVVPATVSAELLQSVARWDPRVVEGLRRVQYQQLAQRRALGVLVEPT